MSSRRLLCLMLLGVLLLGAAAAAAEPAVEESFEIVSDASPATPGPLQILGRLHPALVHLPIAWLLLGLLLAWWPAGDRGESLRRCAPLLFGLSALSALAAATSGLLRADELFSAGAAPPALNLHRNAMLGLSVLLLALFLARWLRPALFRAKAGRWILKGLLLVMSAAMLWAAHMGGELVYGADYLPW